MKVGVLGSGDVGQALARGFAARGHEVKIGSRDPGSDRLRAWLKETRGAITTGTFEEAARFGELIVFSVHGSAVPEVLGDLGPGPFGEKVVIDTTNPLDFSTGSATLLFGLTDSLGERIQRTLPKAKVVKAFNTVSSVQMVDPQFPDGAPEMLICGNDPGAKKTVEGILRDFGWPAALDVGGIEEARWIEPLVPLWVRIGAKLGTWRHALKIVRP